MKLIDIDNLILIDNNIHYIKKYKARAVLMDMRSHIFKYEINFSIEYSPVDPPKIKIGFNEHPHFPIATLTQKIKTKISDMDKAGMFTFLT